MVLALMTHIRHTVSANGRYLHKDNADMLLLSFYSHMTGQADRIHFNNKDIYIINGPKLYSNALHCPNGSSEVKLNSNSENAFQVLFKNKQKYCISSQMLSYGEINYA